MARPPGTIEFRNMQPLPVALHIGDQDLTLPPQGKIQTPISAGKKRMEFKAAALLDNQWRLFASSPLSVRGIDRMMVIFRDSGDTPREGPGDPGIRILRFIDEAQPAAPNLDQASR